ncbi:alpha/beta hydrolase [Kineococcus glutinatus]|uniref:Alpha/beta hydrolase n=1 Tax=Kineococcus glutinatus TaxID=1070872 RepID=A0ABP9HJ77_9ACTN
MLPAAVELLLGACSALGADEPEPVPVGSPTATAAEPAADPAMAEFYAQRLSWQDCGDGVQCSTLTVPVDHADPAGARTRISLVRVPATGDERLGSLVFNPGGPGVGGIPYVRAEGHQVTDVVLEHFDVVGFDPRGVATSDPVRCLTDAETDELLAADATPDDAAERDALVGLAAGVGRGCAARGGELAAHVDTRSAARDLDVLRAALGDDRLSFLGKSYGTFLGATYAELFPQRVGRFVLDGALDPALSEADFEAGQADGFETALAAYVADCLQQRGCPLRGTTEQGVQQVRDLLERIDAAPLDTGTARPLTQSLAQLGVAYPLYASSLWPQLTEALAQALEGGGAKLLALADAYARRGADGGYADNSNTAIYAVNCLDRPDTSTPAEVERSAVELARRSPTFGAFLAWGSLPCTTWPFPATGQPGPLRAAGSGPILVVGTTRDPATPYAWSQALAEQLAEGHLLTRDGDGHTGYRAGSSCTDAAVDAYLVAGAVPADGARCG